MARPKKEKAAASADAKVLQLSAPSFYSMQNSVAHALSVYHQMATNAMQATSQQLGAINAAMLQVQQATTKHMIENSIDPETADLSGYGPLMRVLSLDRNLIGNPLGDPLSVDPQPVVVAPKAPDVKLKKERKPRKPKDPNAPKRPLTGYLMYYTESKDAIEKKLKSTLGEVSKGRVQEEGKNVWNNMSEKEKEVWKEKYKAEWEKYQEAVKEYLAKGGAVDPDALVAPDVNGADLDEVTTVAAVEEDSSSESSSDSESDDEDDEPAKVPTPPPAKKAAKSKKTEAPATKESKPEKKKPAPKDATPKKSALKKDAAPDSTKKADKADSPEAVKKSKKRKSNGAGDEADKADKKKKRKSNSGYGDDY